MDHSQLSRGAKGKEMDSFAPSDQGALPTAADSLTSDGQWASRDDQSGNPPLYRGPNWLDAITFDLNTEGFTRSKADSRIAFSQNEPSSPGSKRRTEKSEHSRTSRRKKMGSLDTRWSNRYAWSEALHERFVYSVFQIGLHHAASTEGLCLQMSAAMMKQPKGRSSLSKIPNKHRLCSERNVRAYLLEYKKRSKEKIQSVRMREIKHGRDFNGEVLYFPKLSREETETYIGKCYQHVWEMLLAMPGTVELEAIGLSKAKVAASAYASTAAATSSLPKATIAQQNQLQIPSFQSSEVQSSVDPMSIFLNLPSEAGGYSRGTLKTQLAIRSDIVALKEQEVEKNEALLAKHREKFAGEELREQERSAGAEVVGRNQGLKSGEGIGGLEVAVGIDLSLGGRKGDNSGQNFGALSDTNEQIFDFLLSDTVSKMG